jgi:phosphatidylserine/phosphatidylglycerophosphate/cardiolipin synthase-like enzyme
MKNKFLLLNFIISFFFTSRTSFAEVDVYFLPKQKAAFVKDLDKHFNELNFGDEVLLAIYWITDLKFINKLVALAKRGVNVKVIFDSSCPIRNKLIKIFIENNIYPFVSLKFINAMHNKFIVLNNYLITGSANFTTPNLGNLFDLKTNNENILILESEEIAKLHRDKFLAIENRILNSYIEKIIEFSNSGDKLPIWLIKLTSNLYFNNTYFRQMVAQQSNKNFNLIFNYLSSIDAK